MTDPLDPNAHEHRRRGGLITGLRNSFLTGLVVIAPIFLTAWLLWSVVGWIDGWVLPFVPDWFKPEHLLNRWLGIPEFLGEGRERTLNPDWITINLRGVGVVVFLMFTVLVGWIAKGLIGRSLLRTAEGLVEGVPVVRSIYNGVKQIAETVFAQSERSFEKACLIQYPREGIWAIGFISTQAKGEVNRRAEVDEQLVSVFVPTTPNPTSGFLLFFPQSNIIELDMSVEDAAKLVISAGLVYPDDKRRGNVTQFPPPGEDAAGG